MFTLNNIVAVHQINKPPNRTKLHTVTRNKGIFGASKENK